MSEPHHAAMQLGLLLRKNKCHITEMTAPVFTRVVRFYYHHFISNNAQTLRR
jgi:hypothetical protein